MMEAYETFEKNGFTAEVRWEEEDSSYCNPRDNDNAAILVCSHRHYRLGDREPTGTEMDAARRGFAVLARYLELTEGALAVQPLYLYDHSIQRMSTASFVGRAQHAEWDSGMVGFAYVPRDNPCGTDAEHAAACIDAEVDEYDKWMSGEVFYFVVKDPDGDEVDSCSGFIGAEYAAEAAEEALDAAADDDEDFRSDDSEPVAEAKAREEFSAAIRRKVER